jgi:hypothetical protein
LSLGQIDLAIESPAYTRSCRAVNFDLALLHRSFEFADTRATEFRLEMFNTFNHTVFFGFVAVKRDIDSPLLGQP